MSHPQLYSDFNWDAIASQRPSLRNEDLFSRQRYPTLCFYYGSVADYSTTWLFGATGVPDDRHRLIVASIRARLNNISDDTPQADRAIRIVFSKSAVRYPLTIPSHGPNVIEQLLRLARRAAATYDGERVADAFRRSIPNEASSYTEASRLVDGYKQRFAKDQDEALDFAFDTFRAWRDGSNMPAFRAAFSSIENGERSENVLPLAIAAYTESFPVRDRLPERAYFRQVAERLVADTVGKKRAESVFRRLG